MTSSTFEPERTFLSQGRSNDQFLANWLFSILYLSRYSTLCLFDLKYGYTSSKNMQKTPKTYTHMVYTYPFQGHGAYLSCLGVSAEQHGHYPLYLTPSPYRQFWNSSYFKKRSTGTVGKKKQGRPCELHREAEVNQEVQSQKPLAVKQRCSVNHWMIVQNPLMLPWQRASDRANGEKEWSQANICDHEIVWDTTMNCVNSATYWLSLKTPDKWPMKYLHLSVAPFRDDILEKGCQIWRWHAGLKEKDHRENSWRWWRRTCWGLVWQRMLQIEAWHTL